MKKRVTIITNVPSPYRVDFFYYLQNNYKDEFDISVLYYCNDSMGRQWKCDEDRLINTHFVKSKTLRIKKRFDDHYISFPVGVGDKLKELNPNVVVAMEYSPAIIMAMHWCRSHHVKYISWTDGTIQSEKRIGYLQKLSRKYIIKNSDAYIGSSSASIDNQVYLGADKSKCFLSLLTVDLDKHVFEPKKEYGNHLICVGSLIERKGVDLLLKALVHVDEKVELDVLGDGQERENLITLSKELGIEKRVHFHGYVSGEELNRAYDSSGAFVIPTREDCFGLVLVEALCASLPIIASKYSDGSAETVVEGENGYIIDPYDEYAFAEAINACFSDSKRQAEFGRKSHEIMDRFSFKNVSVGYIDAIRFVLAQK